MTEIEDPDDATTEYGYSTPAKHEATSETDPDDNTATAHYNSFDMPRMKPSPKKPDRRLDDHDL
jgi:hypothetical protein